MTFTELCADMAVTPEERMKLARHLATLRAEETLRLGVEVSACPHGVPHRWPCEKCATEGSGLDPIRSSDGEVKP